MSEVFLFALPRYLERRTRRFTHPALCALTIGLAPPAWSETITGPITTIRDVDTIVVGQTPVRLNGVDGPERNTAVGREARRWMIDHVGGKILSCVLNGDRSHDRLVGICYAEGRDIGAVAIAAGYALDCPRFSRGRYRGLETKQAKAKISRAPYC
ncbi:MAG: thermonuclease family protein [Pseudomonadota bacterium]